MTWELSSSHFRAHSPVSKSTRGKHGRAHGALAPRVTRRRFVGCQPLQDTTGPGQEPINGSAHVFENRWHRLEPEPPTAGRRTWGCMLYGARRVCEHRYGYRPAPGPALPTAARSAGCCSASRFVRRDQQSMCAHRMAHVWQEPGPLARGRGSPFCIRPGLPSSPRHAAEYRARRSRGRFRHAAAPPRLLPEETKVQAGRRARRVRGGRAGEERAARRGRADGTWGSAARWPGPSPCLTGDVAPDTTPYPADASSRFFRVPLYASLTRQLAPHAAHASSSRLGCEARPGASRTQVERPIGLSSAAH